MKILLLVVGFGVLGVVLGIGTAVVRFQSNAWDSSSLDSGSLTGGRRSPVDIPITEEPLAVIDNAVHDFGVMEASGSGSHDFVITNGGATVLELIPGGTTCKCTLSRISKKKIPPGESSTVSLDWQGKNLAGEFRHTATILTNDVHNPNIVLTIQGRMTGSYRASPRALIFSRITAGDSAVGTVKLFSYLDEPLEISGHRVSDPEHLEVSITPLSAEEVEKEPDAKSGKLLQVTVKSGLPLGRFIETITLDTNVNAVETIEIPVQGNIDSEISIIGPRWSQNDNVLHLGVVDPTVGARQTLLLRVGGANRKEVKFKLATTVPDFLEAELGEPTESSDGRLVVTKLTIRVPKGSRPAAYMGPSRENLGCVFIETTPPGFPDLTVYVRFAVGG
jgi:uncharacterized protein DUF1573